MVNKKGLKCFGLLSLFFIMFGLSLNVSFDVNALQYDVDTIQFWGYNGVSMRPNTWSPPYRFRLVLSDDIDRNLVYSQSVVSASLNSDSQCVAESFSRLPTFGSVSDDRLALNYGFSGQYSDYELQNPCMTVGNLPSIGNNFASIVPLDYVPSVRDNYPYRFSSSGIYRTNTATIDGIVQSKKFDLIDILGADNYPSALYSLELPIIPSPEVANSLLPDTPVVLSGEFIIDMEDPSSPSGLDPSTSTINLRTWYTNKVSSGTDAVADSPVSCSFTFDLDNPDDSTGVYSLKYSCPTSFRSSYSPSTQIPAFFLDIDFSYSSSNTKFSQFIFDSSFVTTNNDFTPGGSFGIISGADLQHAPGSVYNNPYNPDSGDDSNVNWFASLINMFSFGFFNPFAPIFQMFSDNNSCASIPTLAGMIHSEETEVCPWFDSSIRNLVTPVLGLSSMMLVFGFAVRWLGSSSGNLFEDSRHEEVSNQGGRWGHYKKGGY